MKIIKYILTVSVGLFLLINIFYSCTKEVQGENKEGGITKEEIIEDSDIKWKISEYKNGYSILRYTGSDTVDIIFPAEINGKKIYKISKENGIDIFDNKLKIVSVDLSNCIYLEEIGDSSFMQYESLKQIKFPNSLISIGDLALQGCKSLKNIEIPNRITRIGTRVFANCNSLESIEISNNVTYIGKETFSYCVALKNVKLPNSLLHIGEMAFSYTISLETINIPNNVISIGIGTFIYCTSLKEIFIPNSVTYIGAYSFANSGLTSISLPRRFNNYSDLLNRIKIPPSAKIIYYN